MGVAVFPFHQRSRLMFLTQKRQLTKPPHTTMKETEEEKKRHLRKVAQQNSIKRAEIVAKRVLTPEEEEIRLEMEILLTELTGMGTNKTREQLDREFERSIAKLPEAPNLKGNTPPNFEDSDVAIPGVVKDALNEAIEKGVFPLDEPFVLWLEAKAAEYNGVDPKQICAHWKIYHYGKLWQYYPEVATRSTGFTYYAS